MDDITHRLDALNPEIQRILQISGSPALSLGVLQEGALIHTAHFGCRNAGESTPSNDDTNHGVVSLTKLMTAATIARLVHEGKLHWDVPIREYLPAFRIRQDELGVRATLKDLLSMRTGITPANNFLGFQNSEALIKESDTAFTATYLNAAKPFGQFVYSQWNYSLVDEVVKAVTGTSVCGHIEQHIFRPLNMTHSFFGRPQDSDTNIAHTHCTHDDDTATRKPDYPSSLFECGVASAAGARCSLRDYMTFLKAFLRAYKEQVNKGADMIPGSLFPFAASILKPQVGLGPPHRPGIDDLGYCMGVYRTKLPGCLSFASPNFYYTLGRKKLPAYGARLAGLEVFHQAGLGLGHLGAMYLVPSSQTAVVALTNSQPLMDPTDFAAQLALSVLLGQAPAVDFVEMAKLARTITLENYKVLKKVVDNGKTEVAPTKPLAAYEGNYYNAIHNFVVSVRLASDDNGLRVNMQRGNTSFELLPYDGNTFYWPVDREEEMCNKGMFGFMYKDWHLFRFEINADGEVERLLWRHDPYLASPEVFRKTPTSMAFARL
ncbi:beta-lactamase/transpeptidase-like protein [Amniculicola lignicola CBS 123094]|uniref:Beta-lactamase/transpeptidase-like protein n=1 Tax=Amniculicola lignicola CBS 123094 TaxID=1392246 RepID=A0A6A5W576_9PLEO|nr:beta-lactamase/transpeptidase-like protein [Amniculicola lignicola CBS 123094]